MKQGFLYSLLLHLSLLGILLIAPQNSMRDMSDLMVPISVEIEQIEEETHVTENKKAPKIETQPQSAPAEPAPKPPVEEKPVVQEELPEPIFEPEIPSEADIPELLPLPELKPKPEVVKKVEPQPAPKPVQMSRKPQNIAKKTEPKKVEKPDPSKDFESVLKDLRESKKTPPVDELQMEETQDNELMMGKVSDRVSMSELDAVRRQIQQCWNIPAGLREAYDMIIDVEVQVASDGNVQSARIVNNRPDDAAFRAAAESARRATLNPKCNPLKLPPEKYNQWKVMTFRFNPKDLR